MPILFRCQGYSNGITVNIYQLDMFMLIRASLVWLISVYGAVGYAGISKTRGRRVGGNVYCAEHRDCEKKLCTVADLKEKKCVYLYFWQKAHLA